MQYFSASFIQNDNETLSEGKVYIGEKRVRADYSFPTNILIILDKNKAMYYNYELMVLLHDYLLMNCLFVCFKKVSLMYI